MDMKVAEFVINTRYLEHCPEYQPNWKDKAEKYYVAFSHWKGEWILKRTSHTCIPGVTYLRKDVAQKVLTLLNEIT